MPNIDKLLQQNNAGFNTRAFIKPLFEMLNVMQQHEAQKTKSGRQARLVLRNKYYWPLLIGVNTGRCTTSVWTLVFMSLLLAVSFVK